MESSLTVANKKIIGVLGTLTTDQQRAYNNIIDWIDSPYDEKINKRALVGPAGTGKTYLVQSILKNCKIPYNKIGIGSSTHKACRVLKDSLGEDIRVSIKTIHSDMGFRIDFDLDKFDPTNIPFDPKGQCKISNYNLYLVDEASMLNRGLCSYLEKKCKEYKVKLLYIGDASQLAPARETYSPAFRAIVTDSLTQVVRQDDNNPLKDLLNILRNDITNKTWNFIKYMATHRVDITDDNTQGFMVCNDSQFRELIQEYYHNEELLNNVDHVKLVAYTNDVVSGWNKVIRNAIVEDSEKSVVTKNDLFISYSTLVDDYNESIIVNSEDYIVNDIVNYVHPQYGLKGFLVKLQAIHGGNITTPLFICDHTDKVNLSKYVNYTQTLIDNAKRASTSLRASKWKEYFKFKSDVLILVNIKSKNNLIKQRDIDYGFALTSHKSQGSTFNNVFVDMDDMIFTSSGNVYPDADDIRRRIYVALSRARHKCFIKYTK